MFKFCYPLYNSLGERRVRAFINDELKNMGKEVKAIQESKTAIIVISKNYASSISCLNSLATILECFRIECRTIYPIFYDVEPLELQHQTGSYGEVFATLEKLSKHNKQQVQKWRLALSEAANSRGSSYLTTNNRNAISDNDITLGTIIDDVRTRIGRFPLPFLDHSGLEFWTREVISLMDVGSDKEVKMVGIFGIRKSTVARAVCNFIANFFEDLWYFSGYPLDILPWGQDDLSYPMETKFPVSEIARGNGFTLDDFYSSIMQPWFPQKKMLVVLDDVEELDQLGALRECARFGEGSRIIVATRDKQLLVSHGIEKIYDANKMQCEGHILNPK